MSKIPLTPSQKLEAKERDSLLKTINRAKSDFSFGKIKTFRDLLRSVGIDNDTAIKQGYFSWELNEPVDKSFIWDYLLDIKLSFDASKYLIHNPPQPDENYPPQTQINEESIQSNNAIQRTYIFKGFDNVDASELDGSKQVYHHLEPSPKETAFLFWHQKKAANEILESIYQDRRGQLLLAGVGTGKTFILGAVLRRLLDKDFTTSKGSISPFPIVYVTKATIVEQTARVLEKHFGITEQDVTVINIEQLRAKFGSMFLTETIEFQGGQEHVVWKWRKNVFPCLIIWDECQVLKNQDSIQSKIAQSYNDILSKSTYQIFSSATPFTRVCEAKCFAVSTRIPFTFGIAKDAPLTNPHWSSFAEELAAPFDPAEHSPAAIDRLVTRLEKYIVRVKNVHTQFKAINSVKMIDFENQADKIYYEKAWENYLVKKAQIEGSDSANPGMDILAQLGIFRQAAELVRASYLAREMWYAVTHNNQAAIAALNFKNTITKVVRILIEEYHVPREQISLIWGGATKTAKEKENAKKKKIKKSLDLSPEVLQALEEEGITMADLDLDEIEEMPEFKKDIPDEYRLGVQSVAERQREIDRFQSGKSLYCLYTFRAGGVGLSLHHTDEATNFWNTKIETFKGWLDNEIVPWNAKKKLDKDKTLAGKVRHKESGYAFEQDIPYIPTRQRINFVAPTYSAIELVQGLGRAPRLTSLSDTYQYLIFYKGTIEEKVAHIVSVKLRCLGKVVRQKESWEGVMLGKKPSDEYTKPEDNTPEEENTLVEEVPLEEIEV